MKEFSCKGNRLADYLMANGSRLLRVDCVKGVSIFVFEYDDSIDRNIDEWESFQKRAFF